MRYELFGTTPETGQWRWEEGRARRAIQAYEHYQRIESVTKNLDEWYVENLQCGVDLDFVRLSDEGVVQYYVPPQNFRLVSDNWLDIPASGNLTGFAHEKSLALLQRVISWSTRPGDYVLDYFGGSGSTGHAAFSMPPAGEGKRRFILVEMGDYFDTELLPRIKRFIFTPEWKEGKPERLATAEEAERRPRIVKVIRLESYEDALNNLTVRRTEIRTGPKSRVPTSILTEKVSVTNGPSRPPSIAIPTRRTCFPPAKLSRSTATSQDHPRCRRGCSHECGRDRKTSPRLPHLASG